MKKLIVFTVVLALVAGAAFADTAVSGALEYRYTLASGNTEGDGTSATKLELGEAYVQIAYTNDDGSISGILRPKFNHTSFAELNRAFIWWTPIEQVKLFFGRDGDGLFNTAQLSRWGHHRSTRGVSVEDWDAGYYLLGNWDKWGLAAVIKPIDILAINISWDLSDGDSNNLLSYNTEDWIQAIQAQVQLSLDFGNIFITYMNGNHSNWWRGGSSSVIGVTFNSYSLVEGLAFEVGANYWLEEKVDGVVRAVSGSKGEGFITAGIGAHYSAGDFGIRTRFFMEPTRVIGGEETFWMKADLMPFYNLDFGSIFFNVRLILNPSADDTIGWHVNPYFVKNIDAFQFRAGVLFECESGNMDGGIAWKVPIGMVLSF